MKNAAPIGNLPDAVRARLLASVVVHATDAVLITEAEPINLPGPRIIYVNPAFTRMTGYAVDEVIGKTPRLLQGPQTSPFARAQIRAALAAWNPIVIELLNYRKDGSQFWVELSIAPVADETGYFTHWISVQRDITERRNAQQLEVQSRVAAEKRIALSSVSEIRERVEAQLAYSAVHDDLTGLHNRSYFIERIQAAVARSKTDGAYRFSVIHLDLDCFRYVNDRLGYGMGDRVLRDLAQRFERCIGSQNTIARTGGDEFGVLLEGGDGSGDVFAIADRMIVEIAARPKCGPGDVAVTASVGIVHSRPEYRNADAVMRDADTALIRAQQRPGNTFVVFTEEMRDEADLALHLRNDLHGAVARGEMRLFYQPLVDIAMDRVYGFEALVRWQHGERGLVSPADFIPIAEATGLIIEIGRWVLFEGCRMARELQASAKRPLLMSINVSSQQLLHSLFINDLRAALDSTGLDPTTLQLEITESVFLAGTSTIGSLFAQIREWGVRIALDDFGTGYSSLGYLESFQIDTLKIDQSFVARLDEVSARSEIVTVIMTLGHAFGADVVAEGVETRVQRDALAQLGCTHLQGYFYSRPVPPGDAVNLFTERGGEAAKLRALLREPPGETSTVFLSAEQREELRTQVQAAFQTHHTWMDRLQTAVANGESPFDLDRVAREDLCPIGIWLNSTISDTLRKMPLYYVTKSRHAAFHRSMARLLAAVIAKQPSATDSLCHGGNMAMAAASLVQTLHDWLAIADIAAPVDDESCEPFAAGEPRAAFA